MPLLDDALIATAWARILWVEEMFKNLKTLSTGPAFDWKDLLNNIDIIDQRAKKVANWLSDILQEPVVPLHVSGVVGCCTLDRMLREYVIALTGSMPNDWMSVFVINTEGEGPEVCVSLGIGTNAVEPLTPSTTREEIEEAVQRCAFRLLGDEEVEDD